MRALITLIIPLLLLYGCESGGVRPDVSSIPPATHAESLIESGNYEAAATEFLRLAKLYPSESGQYQLQAAHAYIDAEMFDRASQLLDDLELQPSEATLQFFRSVLLAKISISSHQPATALALLDVRIPEGTPNGLIVTMLQVRAEAYELQNLHVNAAMERIRLANYPADRVDVEYNTSRIWSHLVNFNPDELLMLRNSGIDNVRPWVELTTISNSLMSRKDQLKQAVDAWERSYPLHPANGSITAQIIRISQSFNSQPAQIALLLPLTGVFERYAETIRDGFLSAWFNGGSYKPTVKIYDTNYANIHSVYTRAIEEGADFIVGPLEKDAVRVLAEQDYIPVRTLALNQIDYSEINPAILERSGFVPDLIQFGLPPEDEARQVARRSIAEGFNNVLVIMPTDEFGNRVFNAFRKEWTALGGNILELVNYHPQTADFIAPVKTLLNIDGSEARIATLRQRLGRNITATTRIRQDPDFIFMVAPNPTARQIVPHLRFFRAEAVPIYTISYVHSGRPDPQADNDLNGIEFTEVPWLLKSGEAISTTTSPILHGAESSAQGFPRYYAFGIDAYSLISRLGDLALDQTYKFPGETGTLYMTGYGIIQRNLAWARFVNGIPQRIDTRLSP